MRKTAIACVLVVSTICETVAAQSAADKATAQALFDAGKRLLDEGKYAESCPKFAESQRLDPAPGTLLNLADCYEKSGLTASAWATWLEAAAATRNAGQTERERVARGRAAALKTRLVSITIAVPEANRIEGMEVRRDGTVVGIATWGTAVPVDPGSHVVVASAPARRSWQTTVTVVDGVQPVHVTVPRLDTETSPPPIPPAANPPTNFSPMPPANANPNMGSPPMAPPAASPAAPQVQDSGSSDSTQRTLAYVAGGVGIVGIGVGALYGLKAKSKNDDSIAQCRTETICGQSGYDLRQQALDAATYSTVAFGIGSAALITGIVLLATAPSAEKAPTQPQARWAIDAGFTASNGSLTIKGAF